MSVEAEADVPPECLQSNLQPFLPLALRSCMGIVLLTTLGKPPCATFFPSCLLLLLCTLPLGLMTRRSR